jgi:hypothetical protein
MEDEAPSEAVTVLIEEMKVKAENFSTLMRREKPPLLSG